MKFFNTKFNEGEKKSPKQTHNLGIQLESGLKAGACDLWRCDFLDDAFNEAKSGVKNAYSSVKGLFTS